MKSNLRLRVLVPTALLALLGMAAFAFAFSGSPGEDAAPAPIAPHNPAPAAPADEVKLADWAKQAQAICKELNATNSELKTPQSSAELLIVLPQSLTNAEQSLAELRALPAPASEQKRINKMLKHFDQFIALERQAIAAIQAGDIATYASYTGVAYAQNDKGSAIAIDLGAPACGANTSDDSELAKELDKHKLVVVVLYAPGAQLDTLSIEEARAGADMSGAGFVAIDVFDPSEIAVVAAAYPFRTAPSTIVFVRNKGVDSAFERYVDRETVAQAVDNASV